MYIMCVSNNITGACREIVLKSVNLPRECRADAYFTPSRVPVVPMYITL